MMEGNDTLQTLDVSWNGIRGKGASAMMRSVAALIALSTLRVSRNGIGDAGVELGASLAENKSLTELDVACCRMGPEAARALAEGIQRNHSLRRVRLDWNAFCEGARELHAALVLRAGAAQTSFEWSLENVAWDWLDQGLGEGGEEPAARHAEAAARLSGRHSLDLRSPADKEVFLAIARYALTHGASTWRNEMFQHEGVWKRCDLLPPTLLLHANIQYPPL